MIFVISKKLSAAQTSDGSVDFRSREAHFGDPIRSQHKSRPWHGVCSLLCIAYLLWSTAA